MAPSRLGRLQPQTGASDVTTRPNSTLTMTITVVISRGRVGTLFPSFSESENGFSKKCILLISLNQLARLFLWNTWGKLGGSNAGPDSGWGNRGPLNFLRTALDLSNSSFLCILANTRSPEAPAAADIYLHVSPRPTSASVCTAGT